MLVGGKFHEFLVHVISGGARLSFTGCRRCRRALMLWYEWIAGESWQIVLADWVTLSLTEADLS